MILSVQVNRNTRPKKRDFTGASVDNYGGVVVMRIILVMWVVRMDDKLWKI